MKQNTALDGPGRVEFDEDVLLGLEHLVGESVGDDDAHVALLAFGHWLRFEIGPHRSFFKKKRIKFKHRPIKMRFRSKKSVGNKLNQSKSN